jgi:TonB-dependent receptor
VPSGGIGATINIITRRPFDARESGFSGTVGAKALHDSSNSDFSVTPEFSGLLNWVDDEERFGVMIFGAYQFRESAAASATSNDWNIRTYRDFINPANGFVNAQTQITGAPTNLDQLISVPNDSRYHYSESERERINGQLVLQFRPMDSLTLTPTPSMRRTASRRSGPTRPTGSTGRSTEVRFDGNPVVATTVFLQENENGVKDIGFRAAVPRHSGHARILRLQRPLGVQDGLNLNFDAHTSRAKSEPDAPNGSSSTLVSFGAPVVAAHSVDFTGAIPVQDWTLNDALRGNNNGVLDLGDLGSQVGRTNASRQEQRIDQVRLDLGWEFDGHSRLDFGANYIDSSMTSERVSTQQTLGDWGITRPGDINQFAPGLVEQFCMQCQFDHYTPGDAEVAFRGNAVDILNALSAAYAAAPFNRAIAVTGNDFDRVDEEIYSLYAQFTWNGELVGRPTNITGGVRYEHTNVDALGRVAEPIALEWRSDNDFSRIVSDNIITVTRGGEYDNVLPAIDFRIEPMENVVARVSWSKTMARADYGNLFVSDVANAPNRPTAIGGVATGNGGNPALLPLVSNNLDIALEWYFAPSSFVTATFFNKDVKNFVGVGQFQRNLFGLRDPSSGQPGTRSGTARQELLDLGLDITDVNLFTMTALLIQNGGDINAASTQFQANLVGGALNQTFVDSVLAQVDIRGDAADPLFDFRGSPADQQRERQHPRRRIVWPILLRRQRLRHRRLLHLCRRRRRHRRRRRSEREHVRAGRSQ